MKNKRHLLLRVLCALLTLCFATAMATPTAFATSPGEEAAALTTGQRSIINPGGSFSMPGALSESKFLHPGTKSAGWLITKNALQQIFIGNGDPEAFQRIMAYTPIIGMDYELPPEEKFEEKILQYLLQSGINDLFVTFQETKDPDVYRFVSFYVTNEGELTCVYTGILYNVKTGLLAQENGKGIMRIGYDYDASQELLRSASDPWQRPFGFNIFYDILAPLALLQLTTQRFTFTYDGHDWMFQFWKGFYAVSNGAEIGIYEKPSNRPIFWDASDTMLDITMQIYQGDDLYFDTGVVNTWWAGAYSYSRPIYRQLRPKALRLTGTILFEDQGMLDAFLAAFEADRKANMTGGAEGLLFSFDWKADKLALFKSK